MTILKKEENEQNGEKWLSYQIDFYGFPLWLDVSFNDDNEPVIEWNKYIFFDNCATDQNDKRIQENAEYFEQACNLIYEDLETN